MNFVPKIFKTGRPAAWRLPLTATLFLMALALPHWQAKAPECSRENFVFQDGEFLKYKIYFDWKNVWLGMGVSTFEVQPASLNGERVHHAVVRGRTLKRFNWIFRVEDRFDSYFDRETLLTRKFLRDTDEGGYTINQDYNFNRDGSSVIARAEDWKTPRSVDTFGLSGCTHDIVSAIYHMRCIDYAAMEVGDTIPIRVFIDNKVYDLKMDYLGKETIDTKLGRFRCVKVSPSVVGGRIFKDQDRMTIYVTDDDNRIPIYLESPIAFGAVKAILIDHSGLRNPMSSKL